MEYVEPMEPMEYVEYVEHVEYVHPQFLLASFFRFLVGISFYQYHFIPFFLGFSIIPVRRVFSFVFTYIYSRQGTKPLFIPLLWSKYQYDLVFLVPKIR